MNVGRVLASLGAIALASCISTVPKFVRLPPPETSKGVTVTVDETIRAPFGFVGLSGIVRNDSDRTLQACRITLRSLDAEMEPAGRARVVVENLEAGETRQYRADFQRHLKVVHTVLPPEFRLSW